MVEISSVESNNYKNTKYINPPLTTTSSQTGTVCRKYIAYEIVKQPTISFKSTLPSFVIFISPDPETNLKQSFTG